VKHLKIVTAQEMARVEKWAVERGSSQLAFMQEAGLRIAEAAQELVQIHQVPKKATLLVWKGNKSGDAFVAGAHLLEDGFEVQAMHLSPLEDCSELSKHFAQEFQKKGGQFVPLKDPGSEGILIDGLLGTGFSGQVEGLLKEAIEIANQSGMPILAIDIPSGLNGTTGEIGGIAIRASLTVTMGLPKIGLFLNQGLNFVEELIIGDFGLPEEAIAEAQEVAFLIEKECAADLLPAIDRCRHKYQAGFVAGFAGSPGYVGAAKLASLAALRGGAGIVKWFYIKEAQAETFDAPYEVIRIPWSEKEWTLAMQKAKSVFLGPGIGRSEEMRKQLFAMLADLSLPAVLDADALYPDMPMPSSSICTPHRGEMLRLLGKEQMEESELLEACQTFCEEKKTVLVLKGAPTWVFLPNEKPCLIARGDPGMATAGSGDVLTGLLSALLAQGCSAKDAALLGVFLHAVAGEVAAIEKTSYCMIAEDLIDFLPEAFKYLL
jgi:NAD(P)H-hydrate epimerase